MKTEKNSPQNTPEILPITAYIVIYPLLVCLSTLIAAFTLKLGENISKNIIISFVTLAWIPSIILFIRDQNKLRQYVKIHPQFKQIFLNRLLHFSILYTGMVCLVWSITSMIFGFIQGH